MITEEKAVSFEKVILVKDDDAAEIQEILNIKEGYYERADRDGTIESYSTTFETPNGKFGVEIKLCNGNTPYVDAVLFSVRNDAITGNLVWSEMFPLEVSETFFGEYVFEIKEHGIILKVDVVKESDATSEVLEAKIDEFEAIIKKIEDNDSIDRHDLNRIEEINVIIARLNEILEKREA